MLLQAVKDEVKIGQIKFYEGFNNLRIRHSKPVVATPVADKEMRSNKDLWLDPEIRKIHESGDTDFFLYEKAYSGFIICCHVFAYLAGEECLYNSNLSRWERAAANAISTALVKSKMYKEIKEDYTITDFTYDAKNPKVIITPGMIKEARLRYPITINGNYDDSGVEVMDVEEAVMNMGSDKKSEETAIVVVDANGEDIIDGEVVSEESEGKEKVSPIFDYEKMNFVESDFIDVTPTQAKTIADLFGKYIGNREYQLLRIPSGYIQMAFNDRNQYRCCINIDPGLCIGNGYNVVGNIPGNTPGTLDTIMVHYTEDTILNKIFNNPMYVLSPDEIARCMSHMFLNQNIYQWIDMSNMKGRLEKLTKDEFKKLGKKFSFIINSVNDEDKARLRVNYWRSIDEFSLISDNKCKSPFPGNTCEIINGLEVNVKNDTIGVTLPSKIYESYEIDDYGVL